VEALNVLLHMVESLAEGISSVKKYMEVKNYENDMIRNLFGEILTDLRNTLDYPLPQLPSQVFTKLDRLVWDQREKEIILLQDTCEELLKKFNLKPIQDLLVDVEDLMLRLKALAIEVRAQDTVHDIPCTNFSFSPRIVSLMW
jgi:hypothetical protein